LEAVVNGLARANEGQNTALARLGLGYSKAELKVKSFKTVQDELTKEFAGGANEKAKTFEGTMERLEITFGELKEAVGYALLKPLQDLAEAGIAIGNAFGKKGFAGGVEELKFQLQFLLYNADGTLNGIGQQLNTILTVFNRIGQISNRASSTFKAPLALINAVPGVDLSLPQYGTTPTLPTQINATQMQQARRGVTATQGLGASRYMRQNPGSINITIQAGVGDPTAIAKSVRQLLDKYDRRVGGK